MDCFSGFATGSIALWGIWLISSAIGKPPEFDSLSFLFAAIPTSQLMMLGARNRTSDALKTLLALQALINLLVPVCVVFGLGLVPARTILMYAAVGQLAIAYTIAFKLRRSR